MDIRYWKAQAERLYSLIALIILILAVIDVIIYGVRLPLLITASFIILLLFLMTAFYGFLNHKSEAFVSADLAAFKNGVIKDVNVLLNQRSIKSILHGKDGR